MFKFDFDLGSSDFYLNCFDESVDKELRSHSFFDEYEKVDDQFKDGFIYCYEIINGGCTSGMLNPCHKDCKGHNFNIDIVEEILRKHGFKQYPDDAFIFKD